jgi:hypothetical protein
MESRNHDAPHSVFFICSVTVSFLGSKIFLGTPLHYLFVYLWFSKSTVVITDTYSPAKFLLELYTILMTKDST